MKCWDLPALGVYSAALEPGPAHSEAANDQDLRAHRWAPVPRTCHTHSHSAHHLPSLHSWSSYLRGLCLVARLLSQMAQPQLTPSYIPHGLRRPCLFPCSLLTSLQNSLSVRAGPLSFSPTQELSSGTKMLAIKCPTLISSVRR